MEHFSGIFFKIASVTMFVAMASCLKATNGTVPSGELVFFRSFFALPVILVWLIWQKKLSTGLTVKSPMGHVWRGLVGTTAMGLSFAGLTLLPLPEFTAIGYTAPLLVVIFAAMFLGEQVGVFRLSAVFVGMVGVMIVLSPRFSTLGNGLAEKEALGALLVLMGACFAALAQVFIRKLVRTERTSAVVFWFSITATILSLFTIPFGWVWPSAWSLVFLVLAGILGGFGQIFLTSSYRLSDASLVAPFEYSSMIMALLVGYFLFDEVPTTIMLSGAGLVMAAGVAIILRERHLGLKRAQQRKVTGPL
ncbi:DMT family transporter [Falsihalocynthiibacter sp. S25ZX9]|uniref:DMT family transporter n=1 Tax=Falsihalocynthiibacter sp. S25ZX9 TaxID=3240870 RepID=UPI003510BCB9